MSVKTVTERCSSLSRAISCPPSRIKPAVSIRVVNIAAPVGSAVHSHLQHFAVGDYRDPGAVAAEWRIEDEDDIAEVYSLCARGRRAYAEVQRFFPNPNPETYLERSWVFGDIRLTLTGHIDLWSLVDGLELRVADWKTGRLDDDFADQTKGYAALLLNKYPNSASVRVAVIRVREGTVDWELYSREDIDAWLEQTARRLAESSEHYNPTPENCRYCPRGHECQAKTALVKQANDVLGTVTSEWFDSLPLDPEQRGPMLAALLARIKVLESVTKPIRQLIKADVQAFGGVLPASDKQQLEITTEARRTINFERGEDVLRDALGGDLAQCLKVDKTKAEEIVKAGAGKGSKAAAWREVMARLESANAIDERIVEKLEVRKRVPLAIAAAE